MERLIQCISFLYKRITIFLWKRRRVDKFRKTIVTYPGKEKSKKMKKSHSRKVEMKQILGEL